MTAISGDQEECFASRAQDRMQAENRLKSRPRQLTDGDLVEVPQMRKDVIPMPVDAKPTDGAAVDEAGGGDGLADNHTI